MELFMDNLRDAVLGKKSKHGSRADPAALLRGGIMMGLAFLIGRGALCCSMGVCAVALMTVLMAGGRGRVYALPVMAGGMLTGVGTGLAAGGGTLTAGGLWTSYDLLADLTAVLLCVTVFFIIGRKKLPKPLRAAIAAGVVVLTESAAAIASHSLFLYRAEALAGELLLLLAYLYLFDGFFRLLEKGGAGSRGPGEGVLIVSAVVMLAAAGLWTGTVGPLSFLHIMGLLLALLAGYWIGPLEGAVAGLAGGMIMLLAVGEGPAVAGILGCAGAVAGCFRRQGRLQTGVCFAAVCLLFGLSAGRVELYLSVWEPLTAAAVFALLPPVVWRKTETLAGKLARRESPGELTALKRMRTVLTGYEDCFRSLSALYGRTAEGRGPGNPAGDALAYQCRGMAKAVDKLMEELTEPPPLIRRRPRYSLKVGISSYSREKDVSGDSWLCTDFRDDQYLIALSDGMGKGQAAFQESSLALNTLHHLMKAGFDVELALRVLNSILLAKSTEEIYSTVDLGLFDLCTGRLRLFKIGAAATFIKRGDKVQTVKVAALPAGMVPRIPVEDVQIRVRSGDRIIIVSDGVTEAEREDGSMAWLQAAIGEIRSKDPQTVADLLLSRAMERWGLRERDDMTVIAVQVQ